MHRQGVDPGSQIYPHEVEYEGIRENRAYRFSPGYHRRWFVGALPADYDGGVKVSVIKKATMAANVRRLAYAKTENPEVTVALVEIQPGGDTGWHAHAIPVYAYVLSGAITVELEAAGGTISRRASHSRGDQYAAHRQEQGKGAGEARGLLYGRGRGPKYGQGSEMRIIP